jgi:2-polyprenyl-3-methyl-5-hydroxy-6-metoxy-1,4-benzoquinol methylase
MDRARSQALTNLERRRRESDIRLAESVNEVGNLRWWLQQTSDRSDETAGLLTHEVRSRQRIEGELEQIRAELARTKRLVAADVPLDRPGGLELEIFDPGLGTEVVGFRDGGLDENDRVYVGFEDYFRGSEAEVIQRQRAYIPLMRGRGSVLDVGSGRGEFLAVMREAGITAMVERARGSGLEVEEADAVTYLDALPDQSVGAIFAAQVIEHLSYDDLLRFLRAARDKLSPGGILTMETVNPHAPQALKHFWIDPTHRNPLFPETVLALCRLTGFAQGYIWYPQGTGDLDRDRSQQLDYAVVTEAPGAGKSA